MAQSSRSQVCNRPWMLPGTSQTPRNMDEVADWVPQVGMEFKTVDEAFSFWVNFGTHTGFSVRKQYANKSKVDGEVTSRRFVCSNEGNPKANRQNNPPKHPWAEKRTNCPVRMGISYIRESGKYLLHDFVAEHNHVLYVPSTTWGSNVGTKNQDEMLCNTRDMDLWTNNDDAVMGSSSEELSRVEHGDVMTHDISRGDSIVLEGVEPYVGQEFESEADAHAFYNTYAMYVGFVTRVGNLTRSGIDRSIIARTFVCDKEGYQRPIKKNIKPHPRTRMDCKAMFSIKQLSAVKWVATKFVKEHSHLLTPGIQKDFFYHQLPNECTKIQELTRELLVERKRAASYRRTIELLLNHIHEHTEHLSEKIQYIADTVKESKIDENTNENKCRK